MDKLIKNTGINKLIALIVTFVIVQVLISTNIINDYIFQRL